MATRTWNYEAVTWFPKFLLAIKPCSVNTKNIGIWINTMSADVLWISFPRRSAELALTLMIPSNPIIYHYYKFYVFIIHK